MQTQGWMSSLFVLGWVGFVSCLNPTFGISEMMKRQKLGEVVCYLVY